VTVGTKWVCGGSGPAQTGVAPALDIFFWCPCFSYEFVSSHCPTYLFQAMDPDGGRTVHRIMMSAAMVRDIPHLFHAGIFLPSSPNSS
jgi:hypothetical protein